MLDPIARHDFMATVLTAVADDGVSVVLSSHVLAELERVADYLDLDVLGQHPGGGRGRRSTRGPPRADRPDRRGRAIRRTERCACSAAATLKLICSSGATHRRSGATGLGGASIGFEELTLAYLREPGAAALPGPARSWDAEPSEVTR